MSRVVEKSFNSRFALMDSNLSLCVEFLRALIKSSADSVSDASHQKIY